MQLNSGVFEAKLPLSDAPVLGEWTITAELDDEVRDFRTTKLHTDKILYILHHIVATIIMLYVSSLRPKVNLLTSKNMCYRNLELALIWPIIILSKMAKFVL